MIYLDNAATTKPCEAAIKAAIDAAQQCYGNPSSLHGLGVKAEQLINDAKNDILKRLNKKDGDFYFTSGATESSNTIIRGVCETYKRRGNTVITTAMEHPSVGRVMDLMEKQGFKVIRLSPKDNMDNFEEYIADNVNKDVIMVSCMAVNNENGYKTDTERLYKLVKRKKPDTIVHIDGVQGFLKTPLTGDFISLSGHKLHSFKGIGGFYCAKGMRFTPLLYGGGQQKNLRSGTEPVELAASFAAAVKSLPESSKINEYYNRLNLALKNTINALPEVYILSPDLNRAVPNIVSLAVPGVRSEIMLHFLEEREIYVSSGSACSKGKISSVPDAFGVKPQLADSTIRVSFSLENTEQDIFALGEALSDGIKRFRR